MSDRAKLSLTVGFLATFTALVFVATSAIVVETPATKGFFNLGETMVYTAALLGGYYVGMVAGGLGSALADMYLGYPHYAPGTLIIKGLEGLIVGFLALKLKQLNIKQWRLFTLIAAMLGLMLITGLGYNYYHGETHLYFASMEFTLSIPATLWIVLGLLFALAVIYLGFKVDPKVGGEVIAIIVGGLEMVLGYFTYQVMVLGYIPSVAALEIPVNLGQATIGLLVALPLTRTVKAMGARTLT